MVESLKELEKLLKLARKQGVTEITLPSVSFKLGDLPVKHPIESIEDQQEFENPMDEPLSQEELVRWVNE